MQEYNRKAIEEEKEEPRHRKKSASASNSVSKKRANHKHDYEKIIMQMSPDVTDGFYWGKRCKICGHIVDGLGVGREDFIKESRHIPEWHCYVEQYFSLAEVKEKYPGVPVIYSQNVL